MVYRPCIGGHRHRLEYRVRNLLAVPRVHDDRAVQALGRARELAQYQHTLLLLLARNVLVRYLLRSGISKRTEMIIS